MRWSAGTLWSGGEYGPEASILTSAVLFLLFAYLWKAPIRRQPSALLDPPAGDVTCVPGQPFSPSLLTPLLHAADKLTEQDRIELMRGLVAEYATVKQLLPRVQEGALPFESTGSFDKKDWQAASREYGPAGRVGDTVKITKVLHRIRQAGAADQRRIQRRPQVV